jgi:hypothetical protein
MKFLVFLLALSGCDQVFGLERGPADAPADADPHCRPLPDWTTWSFDKVQVNTPGILDGFTARANDFIYASGGKLYEAQALTDIAQSIVYFQGQSDLETPEHSPDGGALTYEVIDAGSASTIWLAQRSSVTTWTGRQALVLPYAPGRNRPGPVITLGADDYRMVVAFDGTLVEMRSADRVEWTAMNTTGFSNHAGGGPDDIDPYLSADGCWLLFGSNRAGAGYGIYATSRADATMAFDLPRQVPGPAADPSHNQSEATMPFDRSALWFLVDPGSSSWSLVKGVPP